MALAQLFSSRSRRSTARALTPLHSDEIIRSQFRRRLPRRLRRQSSFDCDSPLPARVRQHFSRRGRSTCRAAFAAHTSAHLASSPITVSSEISVGSRRFDVLCSQSVITQPVLARLTYRGRRPLAVDIILRNDSHHFR